MDADESLRLKRGFEPSHHPLSYTGRLMRQLGPIVGVLAGFVRSARQQLAVGYRVASQLVRHDRSRLMPAAREHAPEESSGRCSVSPLLEQYVDDFTVLVNGSP